MVNFAWLIAGVKEPKEESPLAFEREPGWCCKSLRWKNASSRSSPFPVVQRRRKMVKPRRLHGYVIIHESKHLSPSTHNSRVQGVRFARCWLENVSKNSGISPAETFNHLARLVGRVVVDH
jgi:hypothetical protein